MADGTAFQKLFGPKAETHAPTDKALAALKSVLNEKPKLTEVPATVNPLKAELEKAPTGFSAFGEAAMPQPQKAPKVIVPKETTVDAPIAAVVTDLSELQAMSFEEQEILKMKQQIQRIKGSLHDADIVGMAIDSVMNALKDHDFLSDNLNSAECGIMVAGLREAYGRTIAKKKETGVKKKKQIKEVDETLDAMEELGLNFEV